MRKLFRCIALLALADALQLQPAGFHSAKQMRQLARKRGGSREGRLTSKLCELFRYKNGVRHMKLTFVGMARTCFKCARGQQLSKDDLRSLHVAAEFLNRVWQVYASLLGLFTILSFIVSAAVIWLASSDGLITHMQISFMFGALVPSLIGLFVRYCQKNNRSALGGRFLIAIGFANFYLILNASLIEFLSNLI